MLCTESDRPVSQLLLFIYWTIVIALHRKRSPCFTIITIYLLDNSYCSAQKAIALFRNYYYLSIGQ
ncbi:hypothetical protein [Okeania sp. KiyG1]|uniref:hypothetical protein n=1 Tax=Okeania sp. KiyG1 TaxID=2720165 RepID=UPI001924FA54|nr:hypothetical protein [Okeania sp. KiyG1]